MHKQKGFTLIELITVIVITGLIGAIGLGFFVSITKSYNVSQDRARVAADGLIILEQLARELRSALPFSARVSTSGNCIEYFPVVGGASYDGLVPTSSNGAPAISNLMISTVDTQLNSALYAFIGGLATSEIYSNSLARSRVGLSTSPAANATSITFAGNHIFKQNSISNRVFFTSNPVRICYVPSSQRLEMYTNPNNIALTLSDAQPSGSSRILMAENITANRAFSISAGNIQESTTVTIALTFSQNDQSVLLSKTVSIRNTP